MSLLGCAHALALRQRSEDYVNEMKYSDGSVSPLNTRDCGKETETRAEDERQRLAIGRKRKRGREEEATGSVCLQSLPSARCDVTHDNFLL